MVQTYKNSYMLKITFIKYFWCNAQQQQENCILSSDYGLQHIQIMFFSYRIKQMHNLLCTFDKPCCVKYFISLKQYRKHNSTKEHLFCNVLCRTEVIMKQRKHASTWKPAESLQEQQKIQV